VLLEAKIRASLGDYPEGFLAGKLLPWADIDPKTGGLFDYQVSPNPYVVRRPQSSIRFAWGVETKTTLLYLQLSCYPDIVDAPVKTLPIRVGYSPIDFLQWRKGSGLVLGGPKATGHELGGWHVRGGIEIPAHYTGRHIIPTFYPIQKLLYLVKPQ